MLGFSQPGIYNVLDYGMSPANDGVTNANALQDAINAAQADPSSNGAIILIPSFYDNSVPEYGSYDIEAPSGTGTSAIVIPNTGQTTPLLIVGTGGGTTLSMITPGSNLFEIDSSSYVTFQDLTIVDSAADETTDGTAFLFSEKGPKQSEGYKLFRVAVIDFPQGINVKSHVNFLNLLQCTILYDEAYSGQPCTGILISGTQTNVEQCSIVFETGVDATDMVAINVVDSQYARVTDTKISGFETGVALGGSNGMGLALGARFSGIAVDATGSCVTIVNPTYDASFVNCSFEPTNTSLPPDVACITIGQTLTDNADYDTIRFTACTATGYALYGLQIIRGQNVQVNGGHYSGNGTAGIAITGDASEIQVTGANCIGTSNAGDTQQYGIHITAGQDIQLVGVNCSGNTVAGIHLLGALASSIQNLRIVGVTCDNSVLGETAQQYGVYLVGASGVVIDGCSLVGNVTYAVYLSSAENVTVSDCDVNSSVSGTIGVFVGGSADIPTTNVYIRGCNGAQYSATTSFLQVVGSVSNLEVTDCAGYNDTQKILLNGTTLPSGTFSGITVDSYYGPTAFYLASTSATTVTIDGQTTHLTSGSFTLAPGETAQIAAGTIVNFLFVGK